MKIRKGILSVLITILVIIILNITSTTVRALTVAPMYLGIEEYRASGYAYQAIEKKMWKIATYEDNTSEAMKNPDMSKTIYCIKAGPGFGSTDMGGSYVGQVKVQPYTQKFDLKDINSKTNPITGNYLNSIPSGEDYNSLIWVLEHCYVPGLETSEKYKKELIAEALKGTDLPTNINISDDEIDIAQQLAIWFFTNSEEDDEYHVTERTFALNVKDKRDASYMYIGDKFNDGSDRNDVAIAIFDYLVEGGLANKNTVPTKTNTENPITLNSSNANIELKDGNYILGPYTITEKSTNIEYKLSATLKNGESDVNYKIVNGSGIQITLEEAVGGEFYISIAKDLYVSGLKFKVIATTYETTLTYWSVANAPTTDQPVVEITRQKKEYPVEVVTPNIPEEKLFDLALRKFITKIGTTAITDRVPDVTSTNLQTLNNGKWTVEKPHKKNPLTVNKGDIVEYTIRIYNEGELDGYALQITDHLPEGLEYIEDSTLNQENGWIPSNDKKTITTSKLSTTLLKAFEGGEISFADVKIECKVVADVTTSDQILKNVAQITDHIDINGNKTDRDSQPNNLTENEIKNYNPGTSTLGWGYQDDDDYEDLLLPGKYFDLSLRKFIKSVKGNELVDVKGKYIKEPIVDVTNLKSGTSTTATYKHQKAPVGVSVGDEVIYTIRVYNEGEIDGYVTEITDYLPPELEYVNDEFNAQYGWKADGRVIKTDITSPNSTSSANRDIIYANRAGGVLLKAYEGGNELNYIDVQIKCKVKSVQNLNTVITNIAEITGFTDNNGNAVIDRDSTADSLTKDNSKPEDDIQLDNLPADSDLPDYKGNSSNKSVLTDSDYHYKGQQDDDDFDKLILKEFDLALRKFITGVNETPVTNRYPLFTTNKDANGNYVYEHTKDPVQVETTDVVEYTIRIFNEGNIAGYAKEIIDDIPNGLEFIPEEETNKEYRWIMYREVKENEQVEPQDIKVFNGKNYTITEDEKQAKIIGTDYLSKEQEIETGRDNLLGEFDTNTMSSPEYKDVKAIFKVIAPNSYEGIITNTAEIADDSDENGNPIIDRDSTPNNNNEKEDDIDVEHIKLIYFDLALRKFITAVDDQEITNRYPVFSIDEEGNYIYTHTKEPVNVENKNIVTYTLRIYNEGTKAGYAKQVKDDLPEGLEFLPENDLNKEYRWVMLDEEGNVTENIEKAVSISTDYLSKEQETKTGRNNLLKPFDSKTMEEPDYRDIKIAFKVTEPNTSDRILINKAQIADDEDEKGNPVIDKDSTPDKWIEGDDDQDIEKVKVKYFDLALRKWVTQAIVIENGKETVTNTGHKAEDDPEEVVKVEIAKNKVNKVVVKFRYSIRITNEGEIPGYATEISDYIPEGLKFVATDNKDWREVDGKIVTNALANTLLKPGESAEVEVLLTWINGNNNMGLKVNVAEISEDKNDSDTPDIDSTPNNKKPGEDDIDDAPVILATKTGELINLNYILLATGSLAIISTGIIFIKKYVL